MSKQPAQNNNKTLLILALVMVVNALAYGTIIPLLYPYATRFGINPLGLGLLFASFSVAQFIATPILGRLSDKIGRKPVLLGCLLGTSLSLGMFAMATSVFWLFLARIIDGVTGGNISVAQAIIADSTEGKDRAKAFGVLGGAFGFGFLAGQAIGGLLSQYGLTVPFWFGAIIGLIGTVLGQMLLPETLSEKSRKAAHGEPMFNFHSLYHALVHPSTGIILAISFLSTLALNMFILGFQSFTVDVLKLGTRDVGLLFALFGIVSIIMQMFGIRYLLNTFPSKKNILVISFVITSAVLFALSMMRSVIPFTAVLVLHMIASSPQMAMITALLSERTKEEDQGGLLGINQSYVSLGQVFGPIMGGAIATRFEVPMIFVAAGVMFAVSAIACRWLFIKPVKVDL